MIETALGPLITVGLPILAGLVASVWRQIQKQRKTKATAIKTVESWESTVEKKNQQIEEWERRFNRLYEDYQRSRAIIRDQDARLARKDERIAHLELLCDSKGTPS